MHTTRCGTERIGTSVHTVRCPVRKLARVGRPRSRSAKSALRSPSSSLSGVSVSGVWAPESMSSRMRWSSARCHESRSRVAVSASAAAPIAAAQSRDRLGGPQLVRRPGARGRRTRPSGPARSIAPLSTSSSGSTPPTIRRSSSVIATPRRIAVESRRARCWRLDDVEPERRSVLLVESPADAAGDDPLLHPRHVVVVEAKAPPDRLAVGQIEQLRRGHPLVGQLEQQRDHAQHRVGLAQAAVGEPDPEVRQPPSLLGLRRPRQRRPGPHRMRPESAGPRSRCPGT